VPGLTWRREPVNWRHLRAGFVTFVLLLLLGTVLSVRGRASYRAPDPAWVSPGPGYRGGIVSPPLPKPEFTLTDTSGRSFDFRIRTRGYVTLLYFGYTHCPDVCPLQMQVIAQAFKGLSPEVASHVKVVFVSTDPERDTPAVLRVWLDHFDKHFIGLTGSAAAVRAAQIAAHITPATKSAPSPNGSYNVGHSAFILAYTRDDLAHVVYPAGVSKNDLAHDLPYLAKETWSSR
jgi:protein SCO1